MFSEMVSGLRTGHLPEPAGLRGRFRAALTKKLALVQQPLTYWEPDPKRNPVTEHLFWAAILLEDQEGLNVVKSVVLIEAEVGKRHQVGLFVDETLARLFSLIRDPKLKRDLDQKIQRLDLTIP